MNFISDTKAEHTIIVWKETVTSGLTESLESGCVTVRMVFGKALSEKKLWIAGICGS